MSNSVKCSCGMPAKTITVWPYRCLCGTRHEKPGGIPEVAPPPTPRRVALTNWTICQTCPHFGEHQYAGMKRTGCGLLKRETESPLPLVDRKPCRTFDHIHAGGHCPDGRFNPAVRIDNPPLKIVTSFSPHRIERQQHCLETWRKYGLPIVAVQLPDEVERVRRNFPGVHVVTDNRVGDAFNKPRHLRIKALTDQATDCPILLINSDISIESSPEEFKADWIDVEDRVFRVGCRWDQNPKGTSLNGSGIDAFRVTPAIGKLLPEHGYCIGMPMWDYWIVWELLLKKYEIAAKIDPGLVHVNHAQGWTQEDLRVGWKLFGQHHKLPPGQLYHVIRGLTGRSRPMPKLAA